MRPARTLFDKVWDAHVVDSLDDGSELLYVDLHLVQEVSSPQAFSALAAAGRKVRRPELTLATMDHNVPTLPGRGPLDELATRQTQALAESCEREGITCYDLASEHQGIVHVIGPELGLSQPGMTVVCGDSHTSTHGALGAIAFGIGTSEVEHVLATQCIAQRRPAKLQLEIAGSAPAGVSAKDLALATMAALGPGGATGHAIEYAGSAVTALSMEGRMTLCNMSIEAGARVGMVAPDETTFGYLAQRPFVQRLGVDLDELVERWSALASDPGASFEREERLDAGSLQPMVTWGTTPAMAVPVASEVPSPESQPDPDAARRALAYQGLSPGQPLADVAVDAVFVGSCTNGRIEDLRAVAAVLQGRRVAEGVRLLVVPGSTAVRRQAESEGLHEIVIAAGGQWREAGCSMCVGMNDDRLAPGERCVSTSNRNFEGRQGPGGRTHLASPATAAASAVAGRICDARRL